MRLWPKRLTPEERAILRRSRVIGWGPFPLPGEKRRRLRIHREITALVSPPGRADDHAH